MTAAAIQRALADISAEADPSLKHLWLASLVTALFRERGKKLLAAALLGEIETDWTEVRRLAQDSAYLNWPTSRNWFMSKPKFSKSGVPTIPMNEPMRWEDWLRGRRVRRETGARVAPLTIRRPSSSSDRRLRKLFRGERGLPFKKTEDL